MNILKGCLIWSLISLGLFIYYLSDMSIDTLIESGKNRFGMTVLVGCGVIYWFLTRILKWERKILLGIIMFILMIILESMPLWLDITKLYICLGVIVLITIALCGGGFVYHIIKGITKNKS